MPQREDDAAPRTGVPGVLDHRSLVQAAGFVLAVAATLVVFLTDNEKFLRLAVIAVAWAFVLATFAAGRRSTERVAARAREAELRRAYELELEREVAARREYELELETELRREAEESMRAELDAMRDNLAGLTELRDEVARVAELRTDIAALSSLRDEVARVAALRDDVAALTSLRRELGQLAELRADMGRLRVELTEQLSSEMLIERIVMRTQAGRLSTDPHNAPGRVLDVAAGWADDVPPRELTGGWPAVRLDEHRQTRQFDQVRVDRAESRPPVPPLPAPPSPISPSEPSWRPSWESDPAQRRRESPATASWETVATPPWDTSSAPSWESAGTGSWSSPSPSSAGDGDRWSASAPAPDGHDDETPVWSSTAKTGTAGRHGRHGADEPAVPTAAFPMAPPSGGAHGGAPSTAVPPVSPPPIAPRPVSEPLYSSPLPSSPEWPAARSLFDAEPTSVRPEVPPRRRRGDEAPENPATALTAQRPVVQPHPPIRVDDRGGYRVAVRDDQAAEAPRPPEQRKRLTDILAENGVSPATGGRRRRRYRDEDEPDDVLRRVLGNN